MVLKFSIKNIDKEKFKVKQIYELLVPTFSQENFLSYIFSKQKRNIDIEDIKTIYEKDNHINILKYLEKVNKNKLVVYTFSPFFAELFAENNYIKNKEFGTLCRENTLELLFNDKLSEMLINSYFDEFYENNNYNLFIIHFKAKDIKYLKYVKFQLDDYHKKNKENENKIFLFIIYIDKNVSENNFKKNYSFFFSFLSEYKQITIDNLLEQKGISIKSLSEISNDQLIITKELMDIDWIIKTEFSKQLNNMESKNDTFINNIDNLSYNGIFGIITKKIQDSLKYTENIIKKYLKKYSDLTIKDNDFITYLKYKVEKMISKKVSILFWEIVNSSYMTKYIYGKVIPPDFLLKFNSLLKKINLEQFDNKEEKSDDYLLELIIPGSKLLFRNLSNLIKKCKYEFINKEDEFRKNIKNKKASKKDEINIFEDINILDNYYNNKIIYLKNELWKEELLEEMIFNEFHVEIKRDLICLLFYNKNKKESISKIQEEFLLFLYELKVKNIINNKNKFLYFFLWAGSYKETIEKFLEIFNIINECFDAGDNFLEELKKKYQLIKFPFKDTNKEKVNEIFYKLSESISEIIIDETIFDYSNIKSLSKICTGLNNIYQIFSHINMIYNLQIKNQYFLNILVKLIEYFLKEEEKYKNKNYNDIQKFVSYINNEKKSILENNYEEAKKYFRFQLDIAIHISKELSIQIFINKLLEYYLNKNYMLEIVKILLKEYPDLIKYSTLFLNFIFLKESLVPQKKDILKIKEEMNEMETHYYLSKFCEFNSKTVNKDILIEINNKAEEDEILKELLLYIFELMIVSYFESCKKNIPFIKRSPYKVLTGLNFKYFKESCRNIINQDFANFKILTMIFYYAFTRCYLYYFVKMEYQVHVERKFLNNLNDFHRNLYDINEQDLGKLISLYIGKLFHFYEVDNKYFLNEYLNNERNYNWKNSLYEQYTNELIFSVKNYDNYNHFLFNVYSTVNLKNEFKKEFMHNLNINDIRSIFSFSYNEMKKKSKDNEFPKSKLLEEIYKNKDFFNFNSKINNKITEVIKKILNLDFINNKDNKINMNLDLFFHVINLYFIGFGGNKKNNSTSIIYSDNIIEFIKIINNNYDNNKILLIDKYYRMKKYLEENNNYIYLCSCGKWYPHDKNKCQEENCKKNLFDSNIIFYDDNQKNNYEKNKKIISRGIIIEKYKKKHIIPLFQDSQKLCDILTKNKQINEKNFWKIFIKFIFLSQLFIDFEIGFVKKEEINKEFDNANLFEEIIDFKTKIEDYFNKSKNDLNTFNNIMNNFSDYYLTFMEEWDYFSNINLFYKFFEGKNILNECNKNNSYKNMETNILTNIVIEENFKDRNLQYFLTATKYPTMEELEELALKSNETIFKSFISEIIKESKNGQKNMDISKLQYIEVINNFINDFSEENKNLISRNQKENKIKDYLTKDITDEKNKIIEDKFNDFVKAYNAINENILIEPYEMSQEQPVKCILIDDKEKSSIYNLYEKLIDIQNKSLKKIIDEYDKYSKEKNKNDILIKNAIEQIKNEIKIQEATKSDVFEFKFKNNIIFSFEELFSFYSTKDIFNNKDNNINYSSYSNIKFDFENIEKELINIILTRKKLFSEKQILFEFYLDPYKEERITKKLKEFNNIYNYEKINDKNKENMLNDMTILTNIFLPHLETLIIYLIKNKNNDSKELISNININKNLYLNKDFLKFLKDYNIKIEQLIDLYEFAEEKLWKRIVDNNVEEKFNCGDFVKSKKDKILDYLNNEEGRELKNNKLISLLIKYICRYLPYEKQKDKNLFETIRDRNSDLSSKEKEELTKLNEIWGVTIDNAITLTDWIIINNNNINKKKQNQNESFISKSSHDIMEENEEDNDNESYEDEEEDEERDY